VMHEVECELRRVNRIARAGIRRGGRPLSCSRVVDQFPSPAGNRMAAEETEEGRPYCRAILPLIANQQFPVQLLGCGSMSVPLQRDFRKRAEAIER
jgi:hypothetical protein